MRKSRIFVDNALPAGQCIVLDERATHYLINVLRCREGEHLLLFNGDGSDYPACISAIKKRHIEVTLSEGIPIANESPIESYLGIAISKGDRFDWVLQKATELGVTHIFPLLTERVNVKLDLRRLEKKQQHWQQVVISACEQSGRAVLPTLHATKNLTDWLAARPETTLSWMLAPEGASLRDASHRIEKSPKTISLLIGPEGGLSDNDVALAAKHDFEALRLGPRILRTETAPIAILSIIQSLWGDID
ncbi:16S rRNA (uracil(1498)-N(3))-methyltransferase [bacterium]|nr:16S rRNA (uracil(1498)-N(3))-methyltransferase [bacterium]